MAENGTFDPPRSAGRDAFAPSSYQLATMDKTLFIMLTLFHLAPVLAPPIPLGRLWN